jgi:hypothetical protein
MRRILLVLLGFGVFAGYGSAIASARWHHRMHNGGGCEGGWEQRSDRFDRFDRRDDPRPAAAVPQTVIVPQAPAPAAPQVFVIMPGMQAAPAIPQIVTVPVQAAAPAPAAAATP